MACAVRILNDDHIQVPQSPSMRSFNNKQKLTFFMEDVLATPKSSPAVVPQSKQSPPPSSAKGDIDSHCLAYQFESL